VESDNSDEEEEFKYEKMDAVELARRNDIVYEL
jgi:hypothetical protein